MGIQINGQTDTVTSTSAGGSVKVTPLAASTGLNVGTGASISSPATNVLTLGTNNTEAVRITSSGTVGIGTTNPQQILHLSASSPNILLQGTNYPALKYAGADGVVDAEMYYGAGGGNDLVVHNYNSGPIIYFINSTERARLTSSGDFLLGTTSTGAQLEIDADNNFAGGDVGCGIRLYHTSTSLGSNNALFGLNCATTNSGSYRMAQFNSGTTRGAFGDAEFVFYGNGTANADGSWVGGGADYAEYFEWSDGNVNDEDRRGISVVLDGNKIREALVGEDPIGVISGNPSMVGDAAWNKWSGKYLRDDYGSYVRDENGERQLNPAYDAEQEYISREERPEWDCVGLMGKLRIRKGQVTGSRWIKMRDVSDNVEEWLVR